MNFPAWCAADKIPTVDDYAQLRVFDKSNLSRGSKYEMTGVFAAGVIGTGGADGAGGRRGDRHTGRRLRGSCGTSYGLAMLGGGAIAGGLGMVGGTYVVTAAGAALGTALGASMTNTYVSEDKSFAIEMFRERPGTPVIVTRGFTTEKDPNWRSAVQMVEQRYPDSPTYRLQWGSKELGKLTALVAKDFGAKLVMAAAGSATTRAGKVAAKKLAPVAPAPLASDLLKNPWHTTVVRADRTGVTLAGILARTEVESYILVGHSLGARAMITAAETVGTSKDTPRIDEMHLLGAAEGKKAN